MQNKKQYSHHLTFISNIELRWDLLVCWPSRTPVWSGDQRRSCGCRLRGGGGPWFRLGLHGGGVGCGAGVMHCVGWQRWKGGEGICGHKDSAISGWDVRWRWKLVCVSWKRGCEGSAVLIQNSTENYSKETHSTHHTLMWPHKYEGRFVSFWFAATHSGFIRKTNN